MFEGGRDKGRERRGRQAAGEEEQEEEVKSQRRGTEDERKRGEAG